MKFEKIMAFYDQKDKEGKTNLAKANEAKVIRRIASTDKNKSFEEVSGEMASEFPKGMVVEDGKLIGLGIHIFNEDVYPLQSFEIYLRSCGLTGTLDLRECQDMIFLDLYHNKITEVKTGDMPAMRILGLQDNNIKEIDVRKLPVCQGIDIGMNQLSAIDVSNNEELVELYVNDNGIKEIDLSNNRKLKYFYCHNNHISVLDTRNNPFLRHLNATGNPMTAIYSVAPQNANMLPLELVAEGEGYVGLKYNPIYNAQWKETGEWEQTYYAYPKEGHNFTGWYDKKGNKISKEKVWKDEYGRSRELVAKFD